MVSRNADCSSRGYSAVLRQSYVSAPGLSRLLLLVRHEILYTLRNFTKFSFQSSTHNSIRPIREILHASC